MTAFLDGLLRNLDGLSSHLWEFLHDLGIGLGSLLRGFVGNLQILGTHP